MDFGSLLHAAQRNEHKAKQESKKCYTTTFSAPKKEQRDNRNLSANIQKFLARRDQEEKKKEEEAKKKRDELLALRSQDGKAKKRVAAMLKRTKAANKSAIEDAVDDDNTAVTLNGPSQPDEDDYGYVSQEASAYYNKLMDKYNNAPAEEPLYSKKKKAVHRDLNSTKDRVRMALLKEEEEEMMPHKRRRRVKNKKENDPGDTTVDYRSSDLTDLGPSKEAEVDSEEEQERQPIKPKIKKTAAPPIMNFQDLLKLAEKKQFEPIKIEPKKKLEEDERPMTKKQRVEFLKEQEWRRRKEEAAAKGGQVNQPPKIPKINRKEDSTQNEKSDSADRRQQRTSGIGHQMKIPKINSAKKEENTVPYPKEEEEEDEVEEEEEERPANNFKKEGRHMGNMRRNENAGPPRQNGNLKRENSFTAPSKASVAIRDEKTMKKVSKDNNDISKKQRGDNDNILLRKSQIYEERERNKAIRNDNSVSNTVKNIPFKMPEGRLNDNVNVKKNSSSSGYDKKLQEAIMAKMQDCQKKKKLEESSFSKPAVKSFQGKDSESKVLKHNERINSGFKGQEKLFSNPDHLVDQRSNFPSPKPNNSSNNRPPQNRNLQNRPDSVPSTKPRMIPPEGKPKPVPTASRPTSSGDFKAKPNLQNSNQRRPVGIPDGRSKAMPPPEVRSKQVTPGSRLKQVPSSEARPKPTAAPASRQFPPADVKTRQFPPADVKPRQFPPADVKSRQFPPADVKTRQFPPSDVRGKQFPPPDVRRNSKPPPKRRITDSDEEYDSEMDDFIDDGPQDEEDYSQHIREIFGYDRRKYSRINDDEDECMESNFATILKEDFISTKTGIMEDLEDIRREKEMERRKKLAKKRK
ncbi:Protein SPT2 homolog [Gryllus bimaculatus]|nr:Protein SPT2 homolog [Gryllus bimaculatus]